MSSSSGAAFIDPLLTEQLETNKLLESLAEQQSQIVTQLELLNLYMSKNIDEVLTLDDIEDN